MKAATDFAARLIEVARVAPMETSPLVTGIAAGTLSRKALRIYAGAIASVGVGFPRRIAAVLAVCDEDEVRRSLIGNLLEEEGAVAFMPGEGVTIVPERRHGVMARKFARAAGVPDGEVGVRSPGGWFRVAMDRGDWLGAYAFFAIGFEANVPVTFRLIVEPLIHHYGFTRDELEYLIEHFVADERHGSDAAQLIARVARTEEARQRALAGAKRGGQAWWALHRVVAEGRLRG